MMGEWQRWLTSAAAKAKRFLALDQGGKAQDLIYAHCADPRATLEAIAEAPGGP